MWISRWRSKVRQAQRCTGNVSHPVSPTLGLVLGEADQPPAFGSECLTVADVQYLNDRIYAARHSQVFGHTEAALIPFQGVDAARPGNKGLDCLAAADPFAPNMIVSKVAMKLPFHRNRSLDRGEDF